MGVLVHGSRLPILCSSVESKGNAQFIMLLYTFPPLDRFCIGSGALCPKEINSKCNKRYWENIRMAFRG